MIRIIALNKAKQNEPLQVISSSSQLLYGCLLPSGIYQMKQLKYSIFNFESILFDTKQLYMIDSFLEGGILRGDSKWPLLDTILKNNQEIISRKIRNPILASRRKYKVFRRLYDLYQVSLCMKSVSYFPNCQIELNLVKNDDEILIDKQSDLDTFVRTIRAPKTTEKVSSNELYYSIEPILYFLLSLRYLDYLRQFYDQLSNEKKVSLKNKLSVSSKLVLNLLTIKDGRTLEQIEIFLNQNHEAKKQGIVQIQMKLFDEIESWAYQQEGIEFTSFNFTTLLFSEGYGINQVSSYRHYPSTTLN